MIVWCTMIVLMNYVDEVLTVETAVKGQVIQTFENNYIVDFSEYAKKEKYQGNFSQRLVKKDDCVKE